MITSQIEYAPTASGEILHQPQVDRLPAGGGVPRVDLGDDRPDGRDVVAVLRDIGAARLQQREEADLAGELGMLVEQQPEGQEAAHDVLARVGAVDAQDQLARRMLDGFVVAEGRQRIEERLGQGRRMRLDLLGGENVVERLRIHGDRIVASQHLAPVDLDRELVPVDGQAEQFLTAGDEVAGVALGVERHDVAAEQATQQPFPHVGRKDAPSVRSGPRNVDEVAEHGVGAALPDALGDQVEVVVLDHHQGAAAAGENLVGHGVGEDPVDGRVTLFERDALVLGEHRGEREPVQAVLDEPEDGVGHHRVEALVRGRIDLDHAHGDDRTFRLLGRPVAVPVRHAVDAVGGQMRDR